MLCSLVLSIGCEGIFALIVDVLLCTTHVPQHVGVVSCGFVDPTVKSESSSASFRFIDRYFAHQLHYCAQQLL